MIYLDNAATTKMRPELANLLLTFCQKEYGNPSSLYDFGLESEQAIVAARSEIAKVLRCSNDEIYFTSGGTESNNIAIQGVMNRTNSRHMILSSIEHASVYELAKRYEQEKSVTYLPVDRYGFVRLEDLEANLTEETNLVSIIYVNNEIGTIQEIEKIGKRIKEINPKTLFHVDGVQAFGKIPVDVKGANIDLFSMSGHKIYAPKGIGAIYIDRKISYLKPLMLGGGQERGFSPGTENVPGIVAMGAASRILDESNETSLVRDVKKYLLSRLKDIEGSYINTPEMSSPYIVNIGFQGILSEILLHYLEREKIYISTGSACSGKARSRVLKSIGVENEYIEGCIRISLSYETTRKDIDVFIDCLQASLKEIRMFTGYKKG